MEERPMKKLKMTRLVLAILALFGFTGVHASGISASALQGSSVYQRYNQQSATSGALGGYQSDQGYETDEEEPWPDAPSVQSDPTQPWKDWIDNNPGHDVTQQEGFNGFTPEQQAELANYQNASQSGSGATQSLDASGLQAWKKYIKDNNITVAELEAGSHFKNLTASDQLTLKLYAKTHQGSANGSPSASQKKHSGGNAKNWAVQYGHQGAQWASNTAVARETKELGNEIYRDIKHDLKKGTEKAAREGINWALKKFGLRSRLPLESPQDSGSGLSDYETQPIQYGPQPATPGVGTLYQGPTTRTAPTPPTSPTPPAPPVTYGSTYNGSTYTPPFTPMSYDSGSYDDSGEEPLVPIAKVSPQGLPFPDQSSTEFSNLDYKDRNWLVKYSQIASKIYVNHSVDPRTLDSWDLIPATGVYSKQTLMNYYNAHN